MENIYERAITESDIESLVARLIRERDDCGEQEIRDLAKPMDDRMFHGFTEAFIESIMTGVSLMDEMLPPEQIFYGMVDNMKKRCQRFKDEYYRAFFAGENTDIILSHHRASRGVMENLAIFSISYASSEIRTEMYSIIHDRLE